MPKDLHELPKLRDSLSYLYIEHANIEQDDQAIVAIQKDGRIPIPIASMTVLMLGPGTTLTHAAVKAIANNGCMVIWCGERASRFYAHGMGETRNASNLLLQARLCMDEALHLEVVRRMYTRRFSDLDCSTMTLQQIRGLEGIRVREAYRQASKQYGIKWRGRDYKSTEWDRADEINIALSTANSCLYGLCHAAIVSLGYSSGLGFVHTGKMLSFVYDIADIYKAETTIPAAFETVSHSNDDLERAVRIACRKTFRDRAILKNIAKDIEWIFQVSNTNDEINLDSVGDLWDDLLDVVPGGNNHAEDI